MKMPQNPCRELPAASVESLPSKGAITDFYKTCILEYTPGVFASSVKKTSAVLG
jgi:hypothetical protein